MPRFMLDTNVCIHAIKRNEPEVVRRLEKTRPQDVAISGIVAAELWTSVMKSRERGRNERALREFLGFVDVLDWPAEAAKVYGEIRAALEQQGKPIGAMDLLIATHALYEHAILATRNTREFERIKELKLVSWA